MSSSISHELNQPLAAIRSYADNAGVLLDQQRNAEARDNLRLISELTARMASIIAHLRAFARRDQHAPERVALQPARSEEHTSELQSLMRISYAVFCLKKKKLTKKKQYE